jgi:hypothetical protein
VRLGDGDRGRRDEPVLPIGDAQFTHGAAGCPV